MNVKRIKLNFKWSKESHVERKEKWAVYKRNVCVYIINFKYAEIKLKEPKCSPGILMLLETSICDQ